MSKPLPAVGKCIYCGTTEPPLHREHIIPYGLEGMLSLPEASCPRCAEITGALEGSCLGKHLGDYRHATNFRSRKRGRKPADRALKIYDQNDNESTIELGRDEFPRALNLPVLPIARALRGLPPDTYGEMIEDGGWWHWAETGRVHKLAVERGIDSFNTGTCNPYDYVRLMAKIAHCAAIAELGIDTFTPLTVDLILGAKGPMNYLVGCGGVEPPPNVPKDALHTGWRMEHSSGMIIQVVQLFAHLGAPAYHVVVGLRPGGQIVQIF